MPRNRFYTWANFVDDCPAAIIVYGTSRQIEANHTLALRCQTTLADAFTETLPPVVRDGEVTTQQLAGHDLVVLGQPADNALSPRARREAPGRASARTSSSSTARRTRRPTTASSSAAEPVDPQRVLYLITANSALQLHEMTKSYAAICRRGRSSAAMR